MNPFPPHVVNTVAFDEAKRLLEWSPLDLSMSLSWNKEEQEWRCEFISGDAYYHFPAASSNAAKAILDAIERVENFGNEEDYRHESY